MKKLLLISLLTLISSLALAQAQSNTPNKNTDNQNSESASFKLFPTQNMYNFIKLDTRNGQMWLVQWSTDTDKRFTSFLNLIPLVTKADEKNGRFTLQATQNIYTFLLIDQLDGGVWQVQWSFDADKRLVIPVL